MRKLYSLITICIHLCIGIYGEANTMTDPHSLMIVFEAQEGKEKALGEELRAVPALVFDEKECLECEIYKSIRNKSKFTLYELWTSEEARLRHSQEKYVEDFFDKIDPLLKIPHQYMTGIMRGE